MASLVREHPLSTVTNAPQQRSDYSSERHRHETFVGGTELLARLDQLLVNADGDRWVGVTGGPSMGKSAILAQLCPTSGRSSDKSDSIAC
jgi:hypothetical protein